MNITSYFDKDLQNDKDNQNSEIKCQKAGHSIPRNKHIRKREPQGNQILLKLRQSLRLTQNWERKVTNAKYVSRRKVIMNMSFKTI